MTRGHEQHKNLRLLKKEPQETLEISSTGYGLVSRNKEAGTRNSEHSKN